VVDRQQGHGTPRAESAQRRKGAAIATPITTPQAPLPTPLRQAGLSLVGVGPGDPELLTVAAVQAIAAADLIAFPVARAGAPGMAATIAGRWIRPEQERLPLSFPMVSEVEPRLAAWRAAADALAGAVRAGRVVVLLCEGDVSLYATASYVLLSLRRHHPDIPLRLIPGISAVAAAGAAAAWPLALQSEGLLIHPTPDSPEGLTALLERAAGGGWVLALLKLGHRWRWVRPLLERRGLLAEAVFAGRIGWPDERLGSAAAVAAGEEPYFSLLLIRQGQPPVLPG
jgi:precorrin-2/cobalt-factor-2 C20-methyltransferase